MVQPERLGYLIIPDMLGGTLLRLYHATLKLFIILLRY